MRLIYLLTLVLLLSACRNSSSKTEESPASKARQTTFVFPEIPEMLTEPEQRLSFLVRHYWDKFDFADTTLLADPAIGEQGFVNFIALFPQTDSTDLTAGLDSLVKRAEPHQEAFAFLLDKADKYLYDPNSPYVNEELYVQFVRPFLASRAIGYADKSRLEFRLELASKNRPGTPATDFKFITYPGKASSSLYATPAEQLLLVFYDPECESCRATLQALMQSDILARKLTENVRVLAVYTEGNADVWAATASGMPRTWQVAADTACTVKDTPLYDLKAMPSLYLLDARKRVILKDASVSALLDYWEGDNRHSSRQQEPGH